MRINKFLTLLLCAGMLTVLCACGKSEGPAEEPVAVEEPVTEAPVEEQPKEEAPLPEPEPWEWTQFEASPEMQELKFSTIMKYDEIWELDKEAVPSEAYYGIIDKYRIQVDDVILYEFDRETCEDIVAKFKAGADARCYKFFAMNAEYNPDRYIEGDSEFNLVVQKTDNVEKTVDYVVCHFRNKSSQLNFVKNAVLYDVTVCNEAMANAWILNGINLASCNDLTVDTVPGFLQDIGFVELDYDLEFQGLNCFPGTYKFVDKSGIYYVCSFFIGNTATYDKAKENGGREERGLYVVGRSIKFDINPESHKVSSIYASAVTQTVLDYYGELARDVTNKETGETETEVVSSRYIYYEPVGENLIPSNVPDFYEQPDMDIIEGDQGADMVEGDTNTDAPPDGGNADGGTDGSQ